MSGMNQHEITLTFTPTNASHGIPLEDFLHQLDAIRQVLSFADKLANNMEHECFAYEISGLSMNSPAKVSLEPIPIWDDCDSATFNPKPILSMVWKLYNGKRLDTCEVCYFEGLRPLAEALRHSRTSSIEIQYEDEKIDVPGNLECLIDEYEKSGPGEVLREAVEQCLIDKDTMLGMPESADHGFYEMYAKQETWELGSVIGRLEAVNFHQRDCGIYTPFSSRPIKCLFSDSLADTVLENLRRRIEAFGRIHTPAGKSLPDKIEIFSIESIPEEPVRSLRSMRGVL